jgi:hypothetical protein
MPNSPSASVAGFEGRLRRTRTKRRAIGLVGAGAVGLSIAGCFSDSASPTGTSVPSLDATADDGSVIEDASPDVTVEGGEPSPDATVVADASMLDAAVDAAAPVEAGDAGDVLDAAEAEAAPPVDAACDASASGSHVLFTFDPTDPEFVSGVSWIDSTATTTANWSAYGGPAHCTDPQEFFGQAYGAPENTTPNVVVGGHLATLAASCDGIASTVTAGPLDCTGAAQLPVTTSYRFGGGAQVDEVKITRTFGFDGSDAATPVFTGVGLRPYVPRVTLAVFSTVIYPNQAGTSVTSEPVGNCPGDCIMTQDTTWSGSWFADIASSGYAIIVLRDPSMTSAVDFTVNYDSYSSSNLSSFVLVQPVAGWQSPLTEIEYLCFADLTTWPQSQRDAAVLPSGCGL